VFSVLGLQPMSLEAWKRGAAQQRAVVVSTSARALSAY
jgi:hypothetical protein